MKFLATATSLFMASTLALLVFSSGYAAEVKTKAGMEKPKALSKEQLYLFGTSFEAVRQLYVDKVDNQKIIENSIQGMLSNLDPHSAYLTKKDLKNLEMMTKGQFTGLGIEVTMEHGIIRVVTPIDGSPAQKAGIKAGDLIVRIDGTPVKGMTLSQAVMKMRGKKNTKIELTILRKSANQPLEVTVTRDEIKMASVRGKILDKHYGYIRIASFQKNTGKDVAKAVKKLEKQTNHGLQGIILDLRNNPGGVLQSSVEVADVFLDANKLSYGKKVVYTKGRIKKMHYEGKAKTADMTKGVPIVVLINMGSASAAEIVAGALQDHKRAVIMGVQSFGKGSVQTVFPLDDGEQGAIKLTTARYYTPAGRSIQAKGIKPDIEVQALKIPDSVKPTEIFSVREASLSKHLEKEKSKAVVKQDDTALLKELKTGAKSAENQPLIYRDYQVYQALTLLKGLNTVKL